MAPSSHTEDPHAVRSSRGLNDFPLETNGQALVEAIRMARNAMNCASKPNPEPSRS
jgi:hypothetical protein